jgi:hypothetical protein
VSAVKEIDSVHTVDADQKDVLDGVSVIGASLVVRDDGRRVTQR